jgi:enamine deaminase RidA (YjgF/YER057c/UK114 family)
MVPTRESLAHHFQEFVHGEAFRGRHARSAIGVASLPGQIPIEIEAVVEVRPSGPSAGARVTLRGPD